MASTAATRSLFIFIDECPSGYPLGCRACTRVGAHNGRAKVCKSRNRSDDLLRAHNGAGVVGHVDVESGVHRLVGVIRRRVSHHRDVVAEFSRKADSRFDAGMRDEPDDDEPLDAVLLELQIQVRVGETAGTPVLRGDNLARPGLELGTDLTAPRAVFEALMPPRRLLNGRNVLPGLIVARTVPMMHCIEDPKFRNSRRVQDLQHMGNAAIRFGNSANAAPYLASLGNEVVIRIDHQKRSDVLVICVCRHGLLTSVRSGLPFSTIYVASSAALTLPTFRAAWIVSAGMNKTSPALSVTGGLPSTSYSSEPSRT